MISLTMNIKSAITLAGFSAALGIAFISALSQSDTLIPNSEEIVKETWAGYKKCFIAGDGRVMRPYDKDTVSEAQAYAMLRAVWMNDKETFDKCYMWTENNLSRAKIKGDNLLAWHWKNGKVSDWMPASDADIDYALSLIFADAQWKGRAPNGAADYGQKARKVIDDILKLETYSTPSGRLYLSPWILNSVERLASQFPVNPSYYSPAHFRIFYEFTGDLRWEKLINTTYYVLGALARNFNNMDGVGLVPDWCAVDSADNFYPLEDKNPDFGWDAVRVPYRVGLDFLWFNSKDAKLFFDLGFSRFIEAEWVKNKAVYCEYKYNGISNNKYENPAFYAAYYCGLLVSASKYSEDILAKVNKYLRQNKGKWVYFDEREYYVNSLAWVADGIKAGVIKNLFTKS